MPTKVNAIKFRFGVYGYFSRNFRFAIFFRNFFLRTCNESIFQIRMYWLKSPKMVLRIFQPLTLGVNVLKLHVSIFPYSVKRKYGRLIVRKIKYGNMKKKTEIKRKCP